MTSSSGSDRFRGVDGCDSGTLGRLLTGIIPLLASKAPGEADDEPLLIVASAGTAASPKVIGLSVSDLWPDDDMVVPHSFGLTVSRTAIRLITCEATVSSNGTRFSPLLRKGVCLSQTYGYVGPWFLTQRDNVQYNNIRIYEIITYNITIIYIISYDVIWFGMSNLFMPSGWAVAAPARCSSLETAQMHMKPPRRSSVRYSSSSNWLAGPKALYPELHLGLQTSGGCHPPLLS